MARHSMYSTNKFSSITAILIISLLTAGIFLPMAPENTAQELAQEIKSLETAGGWSETTIGSTNDDTGKHPYIAIDDNNKVHITHLNTDNNELRISTNSTATSWATNLVSSSSGSVDGRSSMAFNSSGLGRVAYRTANSTVNGTYDLRTAYDSGSGWSGHNVIASGRDMGHYPSIAIDSTDDVHIIHRDNTNGKIRYATDESGTWVDSGIFITSGNDLTGGYFNNIAIDSNDNIFVAYCSSLNNGTLVILQKTSTNWTLAYPDGQGDGCDSASMTIDDDGDVHVVYVKKGSDSLGNSLDFLKYCAQDGGWSCDIVDYSGSYLGESSLALDPDGDAHVAYMRANSSNQNLNDLYYTNKLDGNWSREIVTSSMAQNPSIAVDSEDTVHIAFYQPTQTNLQYTKLVTSTSSNEEIYTSFGTLDDKLDATVSAYNLLEFTNYSVIGNLIDENNQILESITEINFYTGNSTNYYSTSFVQWDDTEEWWSAGEEYCLELKLVKNGEVIHTHSQCVEIPEGNSEAISPGHPVFAEYVGSYWCNPCLDASDSLGDLYETNGGGTTSDDFTFISFWESSSTGWPSEGPINRRSHINGSSIPVTTFGDADQGTYYTVGSQSYTNYYENGGNTADPDNYSLEVVQIENGSNMDIEITATYMGSDSKTVYLYAAVTEEVSPESFSSDTDDHPLHVWRKWLLNSDDSGFKSISLNAGTSITESWSIPLSVVRAGGGNSASENFLTVAALLDGNHTNHRNLVSAADSNMLVEDDPWVIENIGKADQWSSLALDSANNPHVAYRVWEDQNGWKIKYSTETEGSDSSWSEEMIYENRSGSNVEIVLDSEDIPHILYMWNSASSWSDASVDLAIKEGGNWNSTEVTGSYGHVGGYLKAFIDSSDNIHLSYWNYTIANLSYNMYNGNSWSTEYNIDVTNSSNATFGGHMPGSIAVDNQGVVHISYRNYQNGSLKYATNNGGSWSTTTLSDSGNAGLGISMAIDDDGVVHISYIDKANGGTAKYVHGNMGNFDVSTIGSLDGLTNAYLQEYATSLSLDSSGIPHVSYYIEGGVNYASLDENGDWFSETFDNDVGSEWDNFQVLNIKVDSEDNVHILYHNPEESPEYNGQGFEGNPLMYAFLERDSHNDEEIFSELSFNDDQKLKGDYSTNGLIDGELYTIAWAIVDDDGSIEVESEFYIFSSQYNDSGVVTSFTMGSSFLQWGAEYCLILDLLDYEGNQLDQDTVCTTLPSSGNNGPMISNEMRYVGDQNKLMPYWTASNLEVNQSYEVHTSLTDASGIVVQMGTSGFQPANSNFMNSPPGWSPGGDVIEWGMTYCLDITLYDSQGTELDSDDGVCKSVPQENSSGNEEITIEVNMSDRTVIQRFISQDEGWATVMVSLSGLTVGNQYTLTMKMMDGSVSPEVEMFCNNWPSVISTGPCNSEFEFTVEGDIQIFGSHYPALESSTQACVYVDLFDEQMNQIVGNSDCWNQYSTSDWDDDGVIDILDICGETPLNSTVNETGCVINSEINDYDGDGIADNIDQCWDGKDDWTSVSTNDHDGDGCFDGTEDWDDDNDGIEDSQDSCYLGDKNWDSWSGDANGELDHDHDGCRDSTEDQDDDNDGFMDSSDNCPLTRVGAIVDSEGCETDFPDDDNDGVANSYDNCDNTEADVEVDWYGCEIWYDEDGDGVSDEDDLCPDSVGGELVDIEGCSENQRDDDGDGVPNGLDACPDTPPGFDEITDNGCAIGGKEDEIEEEVSEVADEEWWLEIPLLGEVIEQAQSKYGRYISMTTVGLALIGWAYRAATMRSEYKMERRCTKFEKRIDRAKSAKELRVIQVEVEKAQSKKMIPRGAYGDLLSRIELRAEDLGLTDFVTQDTLVEAGISQMDLQDGIEDLRAARDELDLAREDLNRAGGGRRGPPGQRRPETLASNEKIDSSAKSMINRPSYHPMDINQDGVVDEEDDRIWASMSEEERQQRIAQSKKRDVNLVSEIVAFSKIPNGPKAKCNCGSGKAFAKCHMRKIRCPCGSGRLFVKCCAKKRGY